MKDQKTRMFPENTHGMQESVITSIILTTEFLIFSNDVRKSAPSPFMSKLLYICIDLVSFHLLLHLAGPFGIFLIGILDKCCYLPPYDGHSKHFLRC